MKTKTEWQKWRMCGRKRSYHNRQNAKRAAKNRGMYVYECPICFCFHITKIKQYFPMNKLPKEIGQ